METLRKPLFLIAAVLLVLLVLLEAGSGLFIAPAPLNLEADGLQDLRGRVARGEISSEEIHRLNAEKPPGLAISRLALLDGLLLFTILLMGASFLFTDAVHGRIQGIVTLVVSLVVLVGGVIWLFITLQELLLMVGLFLATPFGTIVYLAIWGFFNQSGAAKLLGLSMMLKLGFAISLPLAHQRFLQNKGLMALILTSLVANLLTSFLHGFVPGILVSITDGVAALVILIAVLIWAVFFLIGSVISVVKAVF